MGFTLSLHAGQKRVLADHRRFRVIVAGRRWGKTRCASVAIIIAAAAKQRQLVWYVAPTYQMARDLVWENLKELIPANLIKGKPNETRMTIRLVNGSTIMLKGADKPDSLRGVGIDFLVIDEAQDVKEDTWKLVLRPTLSSTGGRVLFIGTPKAFNWLYDVYQLGQRGNTFLDLHGKLVENPWKSWVYPTITSPFIPREEVEDARRDMDPKSFAQEYLADFTNMSGRVYYGFDRRDHVGDYPFNPHLPILIGQDFNIDPMSSVIIQEQPDGDVWVVDEAILFGSNTQETADEVARRYFRNMNQVVFYPDPAGNSRGHARGESDLDILREAGFNRIKFKRKHPAVADRVNAVNRLLRTADGTIRLRVNRSCKHTIEALEQTIYKEGSREVDKTAGVEHPADALGYFADFEHPVRERKILGLSL